MIKNIALTVACGLVVFAFAYFGNFLRDIYKNNESALSPIINLTSSPTPKPLQNTIEVDSYQISWIEVDDLSKISLRPNLVDHKTAKSLFKENNCKALVNGGFYNESDNHIGLLISGGEKLSDFQENILFNGVLNIGTQSAEIRASYNGSDNATQAGPILVLNESPRSLSIRNDENERRVIAATTEDNKVLFLTVYKKDSTYIGPKLSEVPNILMEFSEKNNLSIKDAINLDGGTASAFYTDRVSLGELTKIGSYFCIEE